MIRLIAAIDRKRGIAKHGFQPWFIPDDEQFFSQQTKKYGGAVLAGRKTFDTFRVPLAGRRNYVLTRHEAPIKGAELVHDLGGFLAEFGDHDLWVVGGAEVYEQAIKKGKADELYLTHIDADFGCDQFFPEYEADFVLADRGDQQEQNGFRFYYARYVRTSK